MIYNLKEMTSDKSSDNKDSMILESKQDQIDLIFDELLTTAINIADGTVNGSFNPEKIFKDSLKAVFNFYDPDNLFKLMMLKIETDSIRLNVAYPRYAKIMTKLSQSEKLNLVGKTIINSKKILPISTIDGYNYTNLDKNMEIKNPFITLIDNLEEFNGILVEIANSDISIQEKVYKLDKLSNNINISIDYNKLTNNTYITDYFRGGPKTQIVYKNYDKVYDRLKTCKNYSVILKKYASDYKYYTNEIRKVVCNSQMKSLFRKYDIKSEVGKKISEILVKEGKLINSVTNTLIQMIAIQLNETMDSLKQDITVINSLVKNFDFVNIEDE